jgi:predicted O-methyltransferase YrrM
MNLLDIENINITSYVMKDWTSWNMKEECYKVIQNCLDYFKPSQIVELGTGLSTRLFCGYVKNNNLPKVISIEHQESFKKERTETLSGLGLEDYSDIKLCDIKDIVVDGKNFHGYDISGLKIPTLDMLLIDSPHRGFGREVCLNMFKDKLSDNAVIIHNNFGLGNMDNCHTAWMEGILKGYNFITFSDNLYVYFKGEL